MIANRFVEGATDKVFKAGHYGWHIVFKQHTYGPFNDEEAAKQVLLDKQNGR